MKNKSVLRPTAFTLIELLVVMGIIVLIGSLIIPAVSGSLKGTALNQATQTVLAQMNNAQQLALARGQTMELRIFKTPDPDSVNASSDSQSTSDTSWLVRGIQLYSVQSNQSVAAGQPGSLSYTPVTKLEFLPNSIIIDPGASNSGAVDASTTLSTLCDPTIEVKTNPNSGTGSSSTKMDKLPRIGSNYYYFKIDFRPDGTTNLNPNQSWFLTLRNLTDGPSALTHPRSNFVTIELDAVQGSTRVFRPQ